MASIITDPSPKTSKSPDTGVTDAAPAIQGASVSGTMNFAVPLSRDPVDAIGNARRHLAAEGTRLRDVSRAARMDAARDALAAGLSAGQAAELAGYSSRSHFARRFREAYGVNPAGFA